MVSLSADLICVQLNKTGHIVVNDFQQTSHPDVYAAGDAVETACAIVPGRRTVVALGGPANRQGACVYLC